jgi:hypothetical protein
VKTPAALFPIALALGGIVLVPWPSARAQDAQEGPIQIDKCQTISEPGSYKLVSNLTAASGAGCLDIIANFVTIDLAGFLISGTHGSGGTASSLTAISAAPNMSNCCANTTVRNGSIDTSGFQLGGVTVGNGSIVEGLHVAGGAAQTFGAIATPDGIVRGNTVIGASGIGIQATGTVTGNNVSDGRSRGMDIGAGSTVIGNTVLRNFAEGLVVACPSNVTDNTAVGNRLSNLQLNGTGCNDTNNVAP